MARPKLARMAWRNIWRNRRRTLITLSSVGFGVTFAIIATGVQDSSFAEMINMAARLSGGHVTLQHPEYLDTPTLSRTLRVGGLRDAALADGDVDRVATRIGGQMMLRSGNKAYGAGFIAFDPAQEDETTLSVIEALEDGAMFESSSERGIVLGATLAENLGLRVGRKVVFMMTDREGEIVQDVARLRATFSTGSPNVDGGLALLPLDRMREVLGYETDEAIELAVFLRDQRGADAAATRLAAVAGSGVAANAWHQTNPDLASFIAMKVAGARFMEAFIALLIMAGIFNTIFVSVMERIREFGVMSALGFGPAALFKLVMYESFWLGLVGLVIAAGLVAWPYYYLSTSGFEIASVLGGGGAGMEVAGVGMAQTMYCRIFPESLAVILVATVLATLLAGLYPAWKAATVEPVESIRLV